jgi:hypothetical protein
MSWFKKDKFTRQMLAKYRNGHLKAVTDFRVVKQHINNARRAGKTAEMSRRLKQFAEQDSLGLDHLLIPAADVTASARRILTDVNVVFGKIDSIDIDALYGEEALWSRLEELVELIRQKLRQVGRRLRS